MKDNRFEAPHSHPRWWYEGKGIPQCFHCSHFRGATKGKVRCEVFHEGVPPEIWAKSKEVKLTTECDMDSKYAS